jgi:hypothetical protein
MSVASAYKTGTYFLKSPTASDIFSLLVCMLGLAMVTFIESDGFQTVGFTAGGVFGAGINLSPDVYR